MVDTSRNMLTTRSARGLLALETLKALHSSGLAAAGPKPNWTCAGQPGDRVLLLSPAQRTEGGRTDREVTFCLMLGLREEFGKACCVSRYRPKQNKARWGVGGSAKTEP